MKPIRLLSITLLMGTLLTGCGKDDPQPTTGKITLTTDWTKRTAGAAIPQTYTARVGEKSASLSGPTNELPELFDAGSYTLYITTIPIK